MGVIQIINKKSEGPFSEGDINLLKAFSSHVFVAVQNCNARVSSTKELEESMSSLHTLRDQLSEIVNTKGTLQKTYERSKQVMDMSRQLSGVLEINKVITSVVQ